MEGLENSDGTSVFSCLEVELTLGLTPAVLLSLQLANGRSQDFS